MNSSHFENIDFQERERICQAQQCVHFKKKVKQVNWYSVRNVLAKEVRLIVIQISIRPESKPIPVRLCVRNANGRNVNVRNTHQG